MKAAEDRSCGHSSTRWHAVSAVDRRTSGWTRNTWTERAVRPRRVKVTHPCRKDSAQVPLAKRYQIVKALTADRANRPLANGVRLRGSHRRLQNVQPQSFDGVIEWARELAVAIADQEPVRMIRWNGFPQLLQCPF